MRIVFAFRPWRSGILLVAGVKADRWNTAYRDAIPLAEQERTHEEEQR